MFVFSVLPAVVFHFLEEQQQNRPCLHEFGGAISILL